jgi:integrase
MKETWENDQATREWLDAFRAKPNTRNTYAVGWRRFIEFTGMIGDQILADRKADTEFRWEGKTLQFRQWMVAEKKLSQNTGRTAAECAEAFFSYHRLPLKFRKSEAATISRAQRKREDYRFNREDLKKMVDVADLTEKYVILVGKSFGLRAGDFACIKRGDLEPYVDREAPISIGVYMTQKETVPAYPFIDADAKPVIKSMLGVMDKEGRVDPDERILDFKDERPLTDALKRVADRAGIKYGNKQVRFHCLRKFLSDHLSSHMSSEKWKQIIGKSIDEDAYISPDSLREDYMKAAPETTLAEVGLEERVKRTEAVTRIQEKILADEKLTPEDHEDIRRYGIRLGKRREGTTQGGGLNFQQQAQDEFAKILLGALKQVKEGLKAPAY